MQSYVALCFATALCLGATVAGESCEVKTQWGDNACSIGGDLQVKSIPGNLLVSSEKCDPFYKKTEFQKQPAVSLPDAKSGEVYTLVMVDPDAPKHPAGTYYLHWIAANIPGDDLKKGELKNAKTITTYRGPSPPDGTGTHRYMFLVFRHDQGTPAAVTQEVPDNQRARFHLGEWLKKQPVKLCGPVSGVQFHTNFSGNSKSQS